MIELVFEIGCEDLPARFVDPALEQLETGFRTRCEQARLDVEGVRTVGTPRRLTLLVEKLAETQTDLEEEQTGPPASVAFEDGEPTGAAEGFARGQGVDVDDLYTVETDRGEYAAARIREEGDPVDEILPDLLDDLLRSLDFPKSMRWADYDERFGRPVRWLLAVAGGEVVPMEFAGVESGDETRGHRFAAPEPFEVRSIEDYRTGLRKADVVVNPGERRASIREKLDEMADAVDGRVVEDPELVDEVVHLVEQPLATRLDYGEEYLELPDEVLVESMRSHQRYFAIEDDESDQLLPHCGVIYNTPVEDPEVVNRGNLRVLRARLNDAQFFWDKDRERSLESRLDELKEVVWLEEVGSMYARSIRIGTVASRLAERLGFDGSTADHAERAGRLSKTDLVTEMVDEFPKLQGVMGREYALADDEPEEVATAIAEQYLPEGAQDEQLPETDTGRCVALAEKLDALVGCFGVEMEPTSSSDPFGLRRAAIGVIRILEASNRSIPVSELVETTLQTGKEANMIHLGDESDETVPFNHFTVGKDELVEALTDFFARRLRYYLTADHPTDVVNAVLATYDGDVAGAIGRVEALAELRGEPDFEPLALGFKRVVNILDKEEEAGLESTGEVDPDRLEEPEEQDLYEAYRTYADRITSAVEARDWTAACEALIELKQPVDAFFDSVMVMADDEALKENRIALLGDIRDLFLQVADISKIQVD
jgi:glycyl-tRNA synthetase beta chain